MCLKWGSWEKAKNLSGVKPAVQRYGHRKGKYILAGFRSTVSFLGDGSPALRALWYMELQQLEHPCTVCILGAALAESPPPNGEVWGGTKSAVSMHSFGSLADLGACTIDTPPAHAPICQPAQTDSNRPLNRPPVLPRGSGIEWHPSLPHEACGFPNPEAIFGR